MKTSVDAKLTVVREFRLEALPRPVAVDTLAKTWGVVTIRHEDISSHGLLLKGKRGYTIVLNRNTSKGRQRFSLAHESGHLLLYKSGYSDFSSGLEPDPAEEKLCDEIAAEILMPRLAFEEDAWMEGWSLRSLRTLSRIYDTSVPATARRIVRLMPETSIMAVWKLGNNIKNAPKLQWTDSQCSRFGVPSGSVVPPTSLELISRTLESSGVQTGSAPIIDTAYGNPRPIVVPAEALAWGRGEYRQAIVFYYPERNQAGTS